MPEIANVNGRICPIEEAVVPAEDRGFLFGDGVYEVVRCYGGRMWAFERHMQRFERSLREIALANLDLETVRRWIADTYEQSAIPDATIYYQATRGAGPRSHAWTGTAKPTFFMTVRPFTDRSEGTRNGIQACTVPDERWGRCDIKSLNLLPNVLAKQKARNQGSYEAILVDKQNQVVEGTSSAVVCLLSGRLVAPPDGTQLLPSITRQFVFEIARKLQIPVEERFVSVTDFLQAEEAFVAATGDEIMGITQVDGKVIGDGRVGQVTRQVYEEYRLRVARGKD